MKKGQSLRVLDLDKELGALKVYMKNLRKVDYGKWRGVAKSLIDLGFPVYVLGGTEKEICPAQAVSLKDVLGGTTYGWIMSMLPHVVRPEVERMVSVEGRKFVVRFASNYISVSDESRAYVFPGVGVVGFSVEGTYVSADLIVGGKRFRVSGSERSFVDTLVEKMDIGVREARFLFYVFYVLGMKDDGSEEAECG